MKGFNSLLCCLPWLLGNSFMAQAVEAELPLEEQRQWYEAAQRELNQGNESEYHRIRSYIHHYPLTPYLDHQVFAKKLAEKSPKEVNAFIKQHQTFSFTGSLRASYLELLANDQKWAAIAAFQKTPPRGQAYQCIYYTSQLKVGNKQKAFEGARSLWLSGRSISTRCDFLFEEWQKTSSFTEQLIYQRLLLAFRSYQPGMLNYLVGMQSSQTYKARSTDVVNLYRNPNLLMDFIKKNNISNDLMPIVNISLQRIAKENTNQAIDAYKKIDELKKLGPAQRQQLAESLASALMLYNDTENTKWRDKILAKTKNTSLLERRIRLSMQQADWAQVNEWIDKWPTANLPMQWQFWKARALTHLDQEERAQSLFSNLLGKRDFYSVAAALTLGKSYQFNKETVQFEPRILDKHQGSLNRIRELLYNQKVVTAKSEWNKLLQRSSQQEKIMLSAYANENSWYHFAVSSSISAKVWNNLELRFPLAHQKLFEYHAEKHDISFITLLSLSRQESGLDRKAISPVGARGIMQIMPDTARYVAKKYQLDFNQTSDLFDIEKNIEIGSHYFNGLLDEYDSNRIFALAAYNAGPHRVTQWRSVTQGKLDVFAFIESIPFYETRKYIKNILMFEIYYRDLLGKESMFLTRNELKTRY